MDGAAAWVAMLTGAVGGPIFSIWFAYHMITHYIPDLMKQNAVETERLIENFRADVRHIVDQKYAGDKLLAEALDGIRLAMIQGQRESASREKREIERDQREHERDERRDQA